LSDIKKEVNKLILITNSQKVESFPLNFHLEQNYPNPFKEKTTIYYGLPYRSKVRLMVIDIDGQVVEKLVSEEHDAGMYEVEFNSGNLPEGIYFYQLIAGQHFSTKKMILMK
jgi:hypothetical protein